MAVNKIKLPNNTTEDIHDSRVLGIDSTPTANSDNLVTSGGVHTSLADKVQGNAKLFFGTSDTAAATAAKVASCSTFTASDLANGTAILVKFPEANTANVDDLTLNVNSTGALPIKKVYASSGLSSLNNAAELRGSTNLFVYTTVNDGSTAYWAIQGCDYNTNTTYSAMSQANIDAGTSTSGLRISPKLLRDNFYTEDEVDALIPDAVEANPTVPSGTTPASLSGLKVGSSYYSVASGGGTITDVTVGGTSVVSNGVAAITLPTVPTISINVKTDKLSNTKTSSPKSVYDEVHPQVESSQPTGGMLPNVIYELGTLTGAVTFTLNTTDVDSNVLNHYYWIFDTSSTAPTITWPQGIITFNGQYTAPQIDAYCRYEISVIDDVLIYSESIYE